MSKVAISPASFMRARLPSILGKPEGAVRGVVASSPITTCWSGRDGGVLPIEGQACDSPAGGVADGEIETAIGVESGIRAPATTPSPARVVREKSCSTPSAGKMANLVGGQAELSKPRHLPRPPRGYAPARRRAGICAVCKTHCRDPICRAEDRLSDYRGPSPLARKSRCSSGSRDWRQARLSLCRFVVARACHHRHASLHPDSIDVTATLTVRMPTQKDDARSRKLHQLCHAKAALLRHSARAMIQT